MKKTWPILALLAVTALSCVKKKVPANESLLGLDYYPLQQGKFVIYNVDSIIYTEIPRDTIIYRYQVKEKISDSFTDNEGHEARRIERYIRRYNPAIAYDSIPWTMKEVWMLNADKTRIQVVESNIRYTKLIFPVEAKASWDGNAANTQGERTYSYEYIENAEKINGVDLAKVLMVRQLYYPTLISHQNYLEKYAKGVGLVYREITDVLSNHIISGKPVLDRIESGIIYRQTLVTYGNE